MYVHATLYYVGNVKCFGNGFLEEAEYCHFDMNSRNSCEAPAQLILEGLSISNSGDGESGICKCGFMKGEKVCIPSERLKVCYKNYVYLWSCICM